MAEIAETMLDDVRDYLNITWQDDKTDKKVIGYINRGMARLQAIAGAPLDFAKEDLPRTLLLDYCRYANSQALEVFEHNFQSELLELNLSTQAPVIDNLVVILGVQEVDGFRITVSPAADEGNRYVYRTGSSIALPQRLDLCVPADGYTEWNGWADIPATAGQDILIAEINDEYRAVRAGKVTVS